MGKDIARALLAAVIIAVLLLVLGMPCKFDFSFLSRIIPLGIYKGG